MLRTCLGRTKVEAHHFTLSNMGGSKNGPIKVSLQETFFEWKIVKMVDLIGRIQFEVRG